MRLNIKAKILGGFMAIIALLVVVAIISWNGLNSLDSAVDHIVHESLPEDQQVRDLEFQIAIQGELYFEYALTLEEEVLEEARSHTEIIEEDFFLLEDELHGEPELLAQIVQIEAEYEEFLFELELVAASYAAGDIQGGLEAIHIAAAEEAVMEEELAELAHEIEAGIEASFLAAESAHSSAINMIIAIAVIAVVALAIGIYLSLSISNGVTAVGGALQRIAVGDVTAEVNIKSQDEIGDMARSYGEMRDYLVEASEVAARIGNGDLTVEVKPRSTGDALGNAFYQMVGSLRTLIGQVSTTVVSLGGASDQLASAAQQAGQATQGISATSQQMASGAQQQTENVDSTTTAMGQLSSAIDQIAKGSQEQATGVEQASTIVGQVSRAVSEVAQNAQSAATGSREANEAAQTGAEMVSKTVEGMQKIEAAVTTASEKITELGTQSAEIGKIVAVIDDIAAQTNPLALNAAIEAARAGEQGRGFAVVADEVRKLAERVTDATKEIASLIDTVQKGVDDSIKATEDGTREVADGATQAQEAGKTLEQILASVETVSSQGEQISAAAEQVSASSDEMVKTIDNVSAVVEENSAATEQMSANSDEVSRSMETLAGITQQSRAAAQEMSASAEEMGAQVEEVVASAESLADMAKGLQSAVWVFKIDQHSESDTNGSGPGRKPRATEYSKDPQRPMPVDEELAMTH